MRHVYLATLMTVLTGAGAVAQRPPAIRQVGRLERVSTDSLASVAAALPMPGGRVLVNDRIARRVLMFDSTLAHPMIVADTTQATDRAYGRAPAALVRYRGDTALLIDQSSLSMFVIGPAGTIARIMAIPRPEDAQEMVSGAAFDARGRLVYFNGLGLLPGALMLGRGDPISSEDNRRRSRDVDSAFLVRVDPGTRVLDTVTALKIPKAKRVLKLDAHALLMAIETTPDPLPLVDGWAMLPDGSMAVVRARDYHVDWIMPDGTSSSTPKMPFEWQRVSDERKQTLIDSTVNAWQATFDRIAGTPAGGGGGGGAGRGGGTGGRGGGGPPGGAGAPGELAPMLAMRSSLSDVPDYFPPITMRPGAVVAGDDGNIWIRTTTMIGGQPVYDVVNRRGEVVDRVQLPSFRTIAGFGKGVVYMAVQERTGVVRLERARVK